MGIKEDVVKVQRTNLPDGLSILNLMLPRKNSRKISLKYHLPPPFFLDQCH